ncbi:MAG TPA: helix-hairpin-helix domain-containing protein [Blastocatellia bacterium]|nr:helix-hairpin-helix domain-containing protein [Blastocatellia bacterium]
MRSKLNLFILSLLLLTVASCKSGESATNTHSVAPANQSEKTAVAQSDKNQPCVNLNIATADDLIKLPGIGEGMAKKIIDYRAQHGQFRRRQDIIIIDGFSEKKYRDIAEMICVK